MGSDLDKDYLVQISRWTEQQTTERSLEMMQAYLRGISTLNHMQPVLWNHKNNQKFSEKYTFIRFHFEEIWMTDLNERSETTRDSQKFSIHIVLFMGISNFACLFYFWLIMSAYFKMRYWEKNSYQSIEKGKFKVFRFGNIFVPMKKKPKQKAEKKKSPITASCKTSISHIFNNKSHISTCSRSCEGGPNVFFFFFF